MDVLWERKDGPLDVRLVRRAGWRLVVASGEIDMSCAPLLLQAVEQALGLAAAPGEDGPHVAIDLQDVRFCDSLGINSLVRSWRRVRGEGGTLVLAQPNESMRHMLHITGLDQHMTVVETLPGDDA